jgi:hypothetical protein
VTPLILRSVHLAHVSKDEAVMRLIETSWFETALTRLLTMRVGYSE